MDRRQYSWGVGVESSIIARNNTFELAAGISPGRIIRDFGGTGIDEAGTWVNRRHVSVLDAYNRANPDQTLAPEVLGTPGPHLPFEPAPAARGLSVAPVPACCPDPACAGG